MNKADDVATALATRVLACLPPVSNAILRLREPTTFLKGPAGDDPLVDRFQQVARTVLAAELLTKAAAELERVARDALAECFADTGCMGVRIDGFTVIPSTSTAGSVITGAVPDEWMATPAPSPDKKRITAALRDGQPLDFASLTNGRPTVSFRTDKARTAA